jgi:hypothetical protein
MLRRLGRYRCHHRQCRPLPPLRGESFRFLFSCRFTFFCYRRLLFSLWARTGRLQMIMSSAISRHFALFLLVKRDEQNHDASLGTASSLYCRYPWYEWECALPSAFPNLFQGFANATLGVWKDFVRLIDTHASCRLDRRDPLRRPVLLSLAVK